MTPSPTPTAGKGPKNPLSPTAIKLLKRRMKKEPLENTLFHRRPYRQLDASNVNININGTLSAPKPLQVSPTPQVKSESDGSPAPSGTSAPAQAQAKSETKLEEKPEDASESPSPDDSAAVAAAAAASAKALAAATPAEEKLGFQDFKLVSCDKHGWAYDVMKLDTRRPVDVLTWAPPVKLNRKELRRELAAGGEGGEGGSVAAGPMLGPDGKPVVGADGRIVMVDAEGRPIHDGQRAVGKDAGKDKDKKKRRFQKKTRQVFLVPDAVRALRREERYPWVLEDGSGSEVWVGRLEDQSRAETRALFMPAAEHVFKFVPGHRWYKFLKRRPDHQVPSLEEAEKIMARHERNRDSDRWLVRQRASAATPSAGGGAGPSLVYDVGGRSLGPGGRRLKTVDSGMRGLFEEDDEEGMDVRRRRERERGGDGDLDEVEYEEDFADDEEKMEPEDTRDEEAKEIEERLKREYRQANKTREGYIDESEEEDEADQHLTGAGKAMKKLVRKIEKNAAYESDEEANPYASSAEEEDDDDSQAPTETGVQQQRSTSKGAASKAGSRVPSRTGSPAPQVQVKSEASPPPNLGMGGHSVLAKRATSPPAARPGVRTGGSRATSPLASSSAGSRPGSPVPPTKKRKAEEGAGAAPSAGNGAQGGKHKKRKPGGGAASPTSPTGPSASSPGPSTPSATPANASASAGASMPPITPQTELTAELLIAWLRTAPGARTRDCIQHFQPCLTDDARKARFTALVKEVASLRGGVLALKEKYVEGG